jgi:hypothetical protein
MRRCRRSEGIFFGLHSSGSTWTVHSVSSNVGRTDSARHVCRLIEAFVGRLDMTELGFVRSEPAETGRPGYDPRDLLKLYLYGYLWQIRSRADWKPSASAT